MYRLDATAQPLSQCRRPGPGLRLRRIALSIPVRGR